MATEEQREHYAALQCNRNNDNPSNSQVINPVTIIQIARDKAVGMAATHTHAANGNVETRKIERTHARKRRSTP